MTKQDLKTGMMVEYRDGGLRLVMRPTLPGAHMLLDHSFRDRSRLDNYDDDLFDNEPSLASNFDIMRVYEPKDNECLYPPRLDGMWKNVWKLIWEREPEVEEEAEGGSLAEQIGDIIKRCEFYNTPKDVLLIMKILDVIMLLAKEADKVRREGA